MMELDTKFDERILGLIAEAIPGKFKKVKLTKETHLQKELGLDSIGMLSLVFRFEESFCIDIAQMGIEINIAKLKTVGDLLDASRDIMTKAETAKVS
jgi:acyl carrier protein